MERIQEVQIFYAPPSGKLSSICSSETKLIYAAYYSKLIDTVRTALFNSFLIHLRRYLEAFNFFFFWRNFRKDHKVSTGPEIT